MGRFSHRTLGVPSSLRIKLRSSDTAAWTITTATVDIKADDGTVLREAQAATIDNAQKRVSYRDDWDVDDDYVVGWYWAIFRVTMDDGDMVVFEGSFEMRAGR